MQRSAVFSRCRRYRYALWRNWSGGPNRASNYVMFVALNPSTADETQDDPTIRRCIAFARSWGYASVCVTNLFALRATHPRDLLADAAPVGPRNDHHIRNIARNAQLIVAAWGMHGAHLGRAAKAKKLLPKLHYLRLTKAGEPGHPLYLPSGLVALPLVNRR